MPALAVLLIFTLQVNAVAAPVHDARGNVVAAARLLGIGRNALRYRMRRLGIDRPSIGEAAPPREAKAFAVEPVEPDDRCRHDGGGEPDGRPGRNRPRHDRGADSH